MTIIIFSVILLLFIEAAVDRRRRAAAKKRHLRNRRLTFSGRAPSGKNIFSVRELAVKKELLRQACALDPEGEECRSLRAN